MRENKRYLAHQRHGLSRNVLLLSIVGGLVLSSFTVLGLYWYTNVEPDPTQQLEIALRLLRKGDNTSAANIARRIDPKMLKKRSDTSKREFLLGTSERKEAEAIPQRRNTIDHNIRAVNHLKKSRDFSFPDGYEGQGNFHLGMALYELFRWDEAEPSLEIAAERWPQGRADSIERLVDIDLSRENDDVDSALQRIENWRLLPRTSSDEDERATIKEMQAHFVRGDYDRSTKLLSSISDESAQRPKAELIYGRCLQKLAGNANEPIRTERLNEAADTFSKVLKRSKTSMQVRRQSNLELGRVLRSLEQKSKAVSTLSVLRLSSVYETEGLVSGLEEIDCLIDLRRFGEVAGTLEHITKNFGKLKWYQNDWMPFEEMQKKLTASGDRMIDGGAYYEATKFANLLPPFCDEIDRLRLNSRLYELWAKKLREHPQKDGVAENCNLLSASAFSSLAAKMMRSPQYSDLLLRAIENYRLAGAFQESNKLLDLYLQFEPRENQPMGFLAKARNYNSLSQPDLALNALHRILESNTSTSLIYDARLEAARLLAAKDNFEEAEALIVENLYFGDLRPESLVWRDSLFELGELSFRRGEKLQSQAVTAIQENPSNAYDKLVLLEQGFTELIRSIARIEEGLRRFEKDPRRLTMLYTTAKAYQLASVWPELLLRENRIANQDTITGWNSQRKELLTQARNTYRSLREEIVAAAETLQANSVTENFLRNSFFGEADLLYESGAYEEAMVAYRDAANRFINEPESLEAMVQIANCQKELKKPADARRTLEMAKDILQRISIEKEARFKAVTSHDRNGWNQYILWMMAELDSK